jgi:serine phosphatase RsbU (regulator of sigma subunit)
MRGAAPTAIIYAHDGLTPARLPRDVASELFGSMPRSARPTVQERTHDELLAMAAGFEGARVALVDLSRCASERAAHALLHTLTENDWTGVALLAPALLESFGSASGRHGLLLRGASTPIPLAGELLRALLEREQSVAALRQEVSLLRRAHERAMHEGEKLQEELHLAAAIQRELAAAHASSTRGIDVGVLARPVNTVSGDVHCVRRVGEHHVAFFLADAVGHGVPAALMTMVLLTGLQAYMQLHEASLDPAAMLDALNRELLSHGFGCDRFATAVCGLIDTRSGAVRVASAGHPSPIIVGPRGTRVLETTGPLLGIFADATFDEACDIIAPDDRLVVYSDGLEGALPRSGTTLLQQLVPLERTLREHAMSDGAGAIDAVASLLDLQSGSLHQTDDVTVLTLAMPRNSARLAA